MQDVLHARALHRPLHDSKTHAHPSARSPTYQAYQILHWGFVLLLAVVGADKFFHLLTWDQYLAPEIERLVPVGGHALLRVAGVVELSAAALVAIRPRVGAYVAAAWLYCVIVDLLLARGHADVALRDFGLIVAAVALARLASVYDHDHHHDTEARRPS